MAETTREQVEHIINRVTTDSRFYSTDEAIEDLMKLVADRELYHAERDSLAHGNIALKKELSKVTAVRDAFLEQYNEKAVEAHSLRKQISEMESYVSDFHFLKDNPLFWKGFNKIMGVNAG